jgi:hypothetical protein
MVPPRANGAGPPQPGDRRQRGRAYHQPDRADPQGRCVGRAKRLRGPGGSEDRCRGQHGGDRGEVPVERARSRHAESPTAWASDRLVQARGGLFRNDGVAAGRGRCRAPGAWRG